MKPDGLNMRRGLKHAIAENEINFI